MIAAPAAVFFAVSGSAYPTDYSTAGGPVTGSAPADATTPAVDESGPRFFSAAPDPIALLAEHPGTGPVEAMPASRWRVLGGEFGGPAIHEALPAGIAPEGGLQVKTILAARNIHVVFPEIQSIGGVRPDALRWHPNGLALDVMIPNPGSAEGIALGNEVASYALANAERFGLQDVIWRGVYYTPNGPQNSGYGHFDHVHITTTGGGYPTGGEVYYR